MISTSLNHCKVMGAEPGRRFLKQPVAKLERAIVILESMSSRFAIMFGCIRMKSLAHLCRNYPWGFCTQAKLESGKRYTIEYFWCQTRQHSTLRKLIALHQPITRHSFNLLKRKCYLLCFSSFEWKHARSIRTSSATKTWKKVHQSHPAFGQWLILTGIKS